jgi:uncharacterized membrane protein YebE (DUF533 family)
MFNAEKLLGGLLSGAMGSSHGSRSGHSLGHGGGLLTGAAGMAAIGLAIGAFEHFTSQKNQPGASGIPQAPGLPPKGLPPIGPSPGATPPPFAPAPGSLPPSAPPSSPPVIPQAEKVSAGPRMPESDAILMIRAMIAAAYADGMLDKQEMKNIMDRMESAGLDSEERQFILRELSNPADIDTIIGEVNTPAMAQQVYSVSLMAIEVDTDKEREYLNALAGRLFLSDAVVARIHDNLGKPK